jgi:3-hydroxyacyl-CoA dehydrogenase
MPLLVNMVRRKKGVKSGEGFYDYSESKKPKDFVIFIVSMFKVNSENCCFLDIRLKFFIYSNWYS